MIAKWAVLQVCAVKVEGEIYQYRTKVGPYNPRKLAASKDTSKDSGGQKKKKDGDKDGDNNASSAQQTALNPRKIFSAALDAVWYECYHNSSYDISI
jgi:hypothetical protein